MNREAVLESVRRYRAIASLYRQTAAFRPGQSWSLLGRATDWERRALAELESYFESIAGTMQTPISKLGPRREQPLEAPQFPCWRREIPCFPKTVPCLIRQGIEQKVPAARGFFDANQALRAAKMQNSL